jgi:hypothetical protein
MELMHTVQVPLYALLLFGGNIAVNHIGGGLTVGGQEGMVKLKAWPRIGILVQQLRYVSKVLQINVLADGGVVACSTLSSCRRWNRAVCLALGRTTRSSRPCLRYWMATGFPSAIYRTKCRVGCGYIA